VDYPDSVGTHHLRPPGAWGHRSHNSSSSSLQKTVANSIRGEYRVVRIELVTNIGYANCLIMDKGCRLRVKLQD
jgi:hypothetical protein